MTLTHDPNTTLIEARTIRALVVVDPQRDFAEGGSLEVRGGYDISERIAAYVRGHRSLYDLVVVTRDWHSEGLADHFADSPDYLDSWPVHCVQDTTGATFLPDIDALLVDGLIDVVVSKGETSAAYSGFEGRTGTHETLDDALRAVGVTHVDVCGIATSHCVRATAASAGTLGYDVTVFSDLSVGVTDELAQSALIELGAAGATITTSRNQP